MFKLDLFQIFLTDSTIHKLIKRSTISKAKKEKNHINKCRKLFDKIVAPIHARTSQ